MKLNHWNRLKVTTAHLGERKVLREVQARFAEQEQPEPVYVPFKIEKQQSDTSSQPVFATQPVSNDLQTLIDLLPVGRWNMNNCKGTLTVNLYTHELHSPQCTFEWCFSGKDVQEVIEKIERYYEKKQEERNYKLFE